MVDRVASYCTLCRSRCGCTNVVENGKLISVEPLPEHPTGGALCAKGRAAPELLASRHRLTKPLKRTAPRHEADPRWSEISWDEAMSEIADRLDKYRNTTGAESVAFAATTPSGTPIGDSIEWIERFVRKFGSPNLLYGIEVCNWHKDHAHALTFGRGIGIPDFDNAETIILWGHNPVRTWLAQATRIGNARLRGARVIVIDPKPDGSGQQCDLWLRIKPSTDGALALGAIRHLIDREKFDQDFVRSWTNAPMLVNTENGQFLRGSDLGWSEDNLEAFAVVNRQGEVKAYDSRRSLEDPSEIVLRAAVDVELPDGASLRCRTAFDLLADAVAPYDLSAVMQATWLKEDDVQQFYKAFEGAPKLAYHAWTGVGQQANATATERAIATLYALTGACDRVGGNIWTVPPPTEPLNSYDLLPIEQQAKAVGLDEKPLGPPSKGWITARDFSRAVLDGEPYKIRALVSFGTNFVVSQGHSTRNLAALRGLEFHVHVDMFLNPTAENADIVLPANLPWERDALKPTFPKWPAA